MRGPSTSIGSSDPRRSNATHQEGTNVDRAHVRCSFRPVSRIHAALSIPIDHWNFQPSHPTSRFDRLFAHAFLALVNRSYSINQSVHSDTYSTVNIYTSNMFFFFLLSTKFPDHKWFPTINDFFFFYIKYNFCLRSLLQLYVRYNTWTVGTTVKWIFTKSFCDEFEIEARRGKEKRGFRGGTHCQPAGQHATDEQKEYSAREHRSSNEETTRDTLCSAPAPLLSPLVMRFYSTFAVPPPPPPWPSPTTSFATRKAPLSWKIHSPCKKVLDPELAIDHARIRQLDQFILILRSISVLSFICVIFISVLSFVRCSDCENFISGFTCLFFFLF